MAGSFVARTGLVLAPCYQFAFHLAATGGDTVEAVWGGLLRESIVMVTLHKGEVAEVPTVETNYRFHKFLCILTQPGVFSREHWAFDYYALSRVTKQLTRVRGECTLPEVMMTLFQRRFRGAEGLQRLAEFHVWADQIAEFDGPLTARVAQQLNRGTPWHRCLRLRPADEVGGTHILSWRSAVEPLQSRFHKFLCITQPCAGCSRPHPETPPAARTSGMARAAAAAHSPL